jgi:hypothetical protein
MSQSAIEGSNASTAGGAGTDSGLKRVRDRFNVKLDDEALYRRKKRTKKRWICTNKMCKHHNPQESITGGATDRSKRGVLLCPRLRCKSPLVPLEQIGTGNEPVSPHPPQSSTRSMVAEETVRKSG